MNISDILTPKERAKAVNKVSIVDTLVNLFIGITKVIISILSGSIAIAGDSILNFGDALSGIVTIYGLKLSNHKPTRKHPFGFGRVEYLTTILASVVTIMIASVFAHISVEHIIDPIETNVTIPEFIIFAILVLFKFYLYYYNKKVFDKTQSGPLEAVSHDSLIDAIGTTCTGLFIFIDKITKLNLDGWISLVIAIFIILSSCLDIYKTINIMIGVQVDSKTIDNIRKTVLATKPIQGVKNIFVHSYGYNIHYGQMDVILPDNLDVLEVSKILKSLEVTLENDYNITFTFGILPEMKKT